MARSDAFVEALAAVPLFQALSPKHLQAVAKQAEQLKAPAGTAVVTEGSAGAEFFVILDGTARVERHGQEVAQLGSGGFFGDLGLLDHAPRNASVIAVTDLELAKLGQRAFDNLVDHESGFAKSLLAGLAKRLRAADASEL
jgi:CRP-like cAMP-binding protein